MIFGFFTPNPHKEARQLAKDVTSIIDMVEQTYRPELLNEIADTTREGIGHIAERCGDDTTCRTRELDRYKALHRESRRQNLQGGLTAYTLIIINTRATALGEVGAPVCALIEQYLQRWPAQSTSEGTPTG